MSERTAQAPIEERLGSLRTELEVGRRRLFELDSEREELRETMLRISGAIQVLEELDGER